MSAEFVASNIFIEFNAFNPIGGGPRLGQRIGFIGFIIIHSINHGDPQAHHESADFRKLSDLARALQARQTKASLATGQTIKLVTTARRTTALRSRARIT